SRTLNKPPTKRLEQRPRRQPFCQTSRRGPPDLSSLFNEDKQQAADLRPTGGSSETGGQQWRRLTPVGCCLLRQVLKRAPSKSRKDCKSTTRHGDAQSTPRTVCCLRRSSEDNRRCGRHPVRVGTSAPAPAPRAAFQGPRRTASATQRARPR
ncbi:uncharacterized protein SCHCODRAFT_02558761, partial [Schizophyllum commune H4-8]|uniref:uncharacterized protein n=1 Tax=Schizophyllum commune (strain H4-8 / FGSC 9210) TaxID=578458 RepID=UPI00215F0D41